MLLMCIILLGFSTSINVADCSPLSLNFIIVDELRGGFSFYHVIIISIFKSNATVSVSRQNLPRPLAIAAVSRRGTTSNLIFL